MLTVRYWAASGREGGISPLGDASRVVTDLPTSERIFRSVITWSALNGLAYRIGACSDPTFRADQLSASLVEVSRYTEGELVHVTYVKKPWNYMHVLHRTAHAADAERLMRRYIELGRSLGRCENARRDLEQPLRAPPYFVYVLTGRLPKKIKAAPEPVKQPATSLVGLAGL